MGRALKPWKRKDRGWWYVEVDGKQVRLSKVKSEAEEMVKQIKRDRILNKSHSPVTVIELLDRYLTWCETNRAAKTLRWYKDFLRDFTEFDRAAARMPASELKPIHVTEWADSREWSNSSRRGAMIAIQRAYNWAVRQEIIDRSPIGTLEKPQAGRRETPAKKADLDELLNACRKQQYKDLLVFAYETGARPQEIRKLEAKHYVTGLDAFVIPVSEAKGKKRARVIHLTDKAREIVERLNRPDGPILRNAHGKPWTSSAINCLMRRLAEKTGKKHACYDLRHGRATELLEAGVDHLTVSAILGHVDSSTLARVYSHIGGNAAHLKAALNGK